MNAKTLITWLPDHLNEPELFELQITKFMPNLELAGNTVRMNVAFLLVNILLRRQLFQNYMVVNLPKD